MNRDLQVKETVRAGMRRVAFGARPSCTMGKLGDKSSWEDVLKSDPSTGPVAVRAGSECKLSGHLQGRASLASLSLCLLSCYPEQRFPCCEGEMTFHLTCVISPCPRLSSRTVVP